MHPQGQTDLSATIWPALSLLPESDIDIDALQTVFIEVLQQLELPIQGPQGLLRLFKSLYLPMACWIADKHNDRSVFIALNGSQGSGKSTTGKILHELISRGMNKSVVTISIDDLYLKHEERQMLSKKIHPLLATRGVPGTHDIKLALEIFSQLASNEATTVQIPVFDKATDDRLPESQWQSIDTPVDIVLFEGWCVSAKAQPDELLKKPVNSLEATEDPQGIWRNYVNQQLATEYQTLFNMMDYLIMLKVPSFDKVDEWRKLQERKLSDYCRKHNLDTTHIMRPEDVSRFIMHYERITRYQLDEMPQRADLLLSVSDNHQIHKVVIQQQNKYE